jgi:gliding motility-associated-like protein
MDVTETHTNLLCFGASTGTITINVTGGVTGASGYTFSWTGPNGFSATTQNLSNIPAGNYTLTVTDASGCTRIIAITLIQPSEIIIVPTTTPISCYGANDATLTLAITGGVGPYQAEWDNFASGTYQENLAAGTYGITVTDGNNCTKTINVVIPEAPIFTINPVHQNISCHGANDGSIVLNFVGGQAPITLIWSDGSTSGTSRHNLPPGIYTVTITDSKPCVITRTFVITEPQPLVLSGSVTHANDCNNTMSGAVNLLVSGGMPPFTYAWSNGATTEDLSGITSGNYSVTVTDANGCTNFKQFTVTRPQPLQVSVANDISFNCDTDFVRQVNTATASGGVLPYQYTWSAGTVSGANGQIMSTNNNGMVTVTVTDGMGCTAAHTFEIDTQQLGDASYGVASYAYSTYGLYSIVDPIQFTNTSSGDYISVAWDFGDGVVSTENDPVHVYQREGNYTVTQTVTYPYGCVERNTFLLVIDKGYDIMIPTGFTPNGDGTNDLYNAQHRGLKKLEMSIYDTWGSLIYSEQGETLRGWDGTLNGRPAENGNYVYKFTATTFYGHTLDFTAPFTLLK